MSTQLYEQIIGVAENYLGPAAQRFIERQIAFHLQKEPYEITIEDLPKLIEWNKITLGLLTNDHATVDNYARDMQRLIPNGLSHR